jgi:hypothetical protein
LGDVTNDGINDFYCMSHDQGWDRKSSLLYRSNSSLALADITGSAFGGITATGGGQGCLFVDLDADGDLDLLTGSNDGVGCALRNNGDGTFGWYEGFPGYYGDVNSRELSAGDMDGDGDVDVISGIHHQNMRIYRNNGLGVYDKSEISFSGETTCGSTLPIVADMDNDGDLDIVSQYMSAFGTCSPQRPITVDLWLNDGTGRIQWVSDTRGLVGGEEECTLLVGDFDNDADLDIIQLTNWNQGVNGRNRYYVNDGTGHFSEQSASRGLEGNTAYTDWWSKAIAGDFDNDGDLDLYYRLGLWTNDGNGNFSHSELSGLSGRINAAGDLDGDGDLDLAGARAHYEVSGDGFWVFRNNTNNNNWLIVNAIDGTLNPYGIGAKISVYDGSRLVGYRQVIDASAMQQPLEQHFGLGSVSTVRVEVVFMDGTVTIRDNVSAGQEITITKESNPVPPSTPSGLAASGTDFGCADLTWDSPSSSQRVDRYVLAWGPSPGTYDDSTVVSTADITNQGGTSSYRHCLGVAGEYCFALRAHNVYDLWSAYSGAACATVTNDSTSLQPSTPTGLAASGTDVGCADLSWNTPDPAETVDRYVLAWGPSPGNYDDSTVVNTADITDQGGTSSYRHCLTSEGQYCFALRAHNTYDLWSAYSGAECAAVTNDSTSLQPSIPSGFTASNSNVGCADLSWSAPDPSETVDRYVLAWGSSTGAYTDSTVVDWGAVTTQGGISSYSHCLPDTGFYCFVVRAHNTHGLWSAYSTESCVTVTNGLAQPPPPPTSVSATEVDFGTASVSWNPVGDPTVAGYMVYYGDASVEGGAASAYGDSVDAQTNTNAVIPGLAAGTYYFAVRTYTGTGDRSAYSPERSLVMAGVDDAPPAVSTRTPADGATGVAVNAVVFFTMTDDKAGVDQNTVTVTVNGSQVTPLQFSGDPSNLSVTAAPEQDLPPLSTVVVEVTASDLASTPNPLVESWSFQTADAPVTDTSPPVFSGLRPTNGAVGVAPDAQVRVTVSDAVMGVDAGSIVFYVNDLAVAYSTQGDPSSLTLIYENPDGFEPASSVRVRITACDLASPPNCAELSDYSFTVATDASAPVAQGEGEVVPNGYWEGNPSRPMEVKNLPLSWTVRIFDAAGRLVREYTNRAADGQDWVWDFANDHGQRVARGLYLVRVTGPDGDVQQSGRFLVQSDS